MGSSKFAKIANGVVDVISYYPDREKVVDYEVRDGEQVEVGWHWGAVLPPWEPVGEDVFAGFVRDALGGFSPPVLTETPSPAPYPPLSRLTFWLAAAEIGVTKAGIRAHIGSMPEGVEKFQALAYLEEAQVYRREDPLLIQMAAVEGITEPELDALWAWASQTYP